MLLTLALLLQFSLLLVSSAVEINDDLVCSPYSTYNESHKVCMCPDEMKRFIHCNESGYIDAVKDCSCVTYNEDTDKIEVGYCVYGCSRDLDTSYSNRPNGYSFIGTDKYQWNQLICGPFQRTGTLCGSCMNGSYPPAYSFDVKCIKCTNSYLNIFKYLLWAFLPLTVFYITFLLLQINVLSSPLFGLVIYCQMFSQNSVIKVLIVNKHDETFIVNSIRTTETLFSIWNLDFFRTFNHGLCLKSDTLTTISLDFFIAIYPLFLLILTYVFILLYDNKCRLFIAVLKPFQIFFLLFKKKWSIRTSMINTFAAFVLLSNVKLLSTCFDILILVDVYQFNSLKNFTVKHSKRLYSDATMEFLGPKHLPYAILALLVFCIFVFLPVLILFLYPFKLFQHFVSKCPSRYTIFLNTFVDCFQGCYKDGTQPGSRDYRLVSVVPFVFRWVCYIIYTLTLNATTLPLISMINVIAVLLFILLDPMQDQFYSMSYYLIIITIISAICCVCASGTDIVQATGESMPLMYFFYLVYIIVTVLPLLGVALFILRLLCKYIKKLISARQKELL